MHAVVYRDYGEPAVLEPAEVETPTPARDEVLIRVVAASVNPVDARLRSGEMKWLLPGGFPRIPGYDVAGFVEAAGEETTFSVGDRVMAFLDHIYGGGSAEFAVCSGTSVISVPDEMPFEEAAAIPLAASTALQSLRDHGHLEAGQSVLVNGASGGVGAFAVQIAKAAGAVVTGVASGPHAEFVSSLGADDFIDYREQSFLETGRKWDIIFDAAGKSSFGEARSSLTENGHYVSTEPTVRGLIVSLVTRPMHQQGDVMLVRSRQKDLQHLLQLYSSGALRVRIADRFPLDAAAAAHAKIEQGGFCGKLVLLVSPSHRGE